MQVPASNVYFGDGRSGKLGNYTIQSGDTLGKIAKDAGMSLADVQKVNPGLTNVNNIRAGAKLFLPADKLKTLNDTRAYIGTAKALDTLQKQAIASGSHEKQPGDAFIAPGSKEQTARDLKITQADKSIAMGAGVLGAESLVALEDSHLPASILAATDGLHSPVVANDSIFSALSNRSGLGVSGKIETLAEREASTKLAKQSVTDKSLLLQALSNGVGDKILAELDPEESQASTPLAEVPNDDPNNPNLM